MLRLIFFLLLILLLIQSPFYKKEIVPYYKKIEASVNKLFVVKPDSLGPEKPRTYFPGPVAPYNPPQPTVSQSNDSLDDAGALSASPYLKGTSMKRK